MAMIEVEASVLNVEKENIIKTIYDLETAGIDYFHIDVMDGKFVENDTTSKMNEFCEYMKNITNIPINVHLMVENVKDYINSFLVFEPNSITFHVEACKNQKQVHELIDFIKENNCKVGISINPKTPVESIYEYLPYIHSVLVMSVEPGKGGQKFIPETLNKIEELNKFIYENGYETNIIVDGGINEETSKDVINKGVNIIVTGNYLITSEDYKKKVEELKNKK